MASSTSLESEIAEWIVKLIEDEKLLDAIEEQKGIDAAIESIKKRNGVPAFGFDHLSRRVNVRAASVVLKSLGLLEVIAVDKSISLKTGEVLRPDILCFNPESRTLVVRATREFVERNITPVTNKDEWACFKLIGSPASTNQVMSFLPCINIMRKNGRS